MKLAVTADLHLPITPSTVIAALAGEMNAYRPDTLIVAGDVAESPDDIARCLAILKKRVDCPVWVLPGNHDLWARSGIRSQRLFEERLPEIVEEAGCHWLEGKSLTLDGVWVAGTIAWYDYTAADPSVKATPREFAENKRYYNMDAAFINWSWSDPEFAVRVTGPFLAELDRLEADAAVRQVIAITHVPVLEEQMCRNSGNPDWAFSNAYFGNLTLGRELLRRRKVTHVISGHTHVGREADVAAADGRRVRAVVVPSEYGRPAWVGVTTSD